jgi:hypothetical protein
MAYIILKKDPISGQYIGKKNTLNALFEVGYRLFHIDYPWELHFSIKSCEY